MKKTFLLAWLSILCVLVQAQTDSTKIKISQLSLVTGGMDSSLVPVIVNGNTRKVYGVDLSKAALNKKLNSIDTTGKWMPKGFVETDPSYNSSAASYVTFQSLTNWDAAYSSVSSIGTLNSLTTTSKNNLVAAINEVNAKPSGGGSATLYSTTGSNTDGAMTQAATTTALGAKQDTAGAKIYFSSTDFYRDGATTATSLKVLGKADSTATATALAGKQGTITLTTTGTSGAATLTGNTLNIPNYATTGGGGGGSVGTPVGANMYRLASQSFTGGADTKVLFDNTDFDNDGTVADLTNNRFNITTTGIYIIAIQARLNTVASGEHVIKASKNGTTELLRAVQYEYNSGIATQMNGSMVIKLTAGDYVEMFVNVPTTTSSIGSIPTVSPRMSIAQIK